jgi:hypothetical protein
MNNIFNQDDYNSSNGMITNIWGPPMWHVLHTISFNYPLNPTNNDKKNYYNFYHNLQNILPCKTCRDNLKKNFKTLPLTLDVFKNRHILSKYIYDLHELVNASLNKKSNLTYEYVRDIYEHFRARCSTEKDKGCINPLNGIKSKCVLKIMPEKSKEKSFNIDSRCLTKKNKKNSKKK